MLEGFTKQHDVKNLVYYECHETAEAAIERETFEAMEERMETWFYQKNEYFMEWFVWKYFVMFVIYHIFTLTNLQ